MRRLNNMQRADVGNLLSSLAVWPWWIWMCQVLDAQDVIRCPDCPAATRSGQSAQEEHYRTVVYRGRVVVCATTSTAQVVSKMREGTKRVPASRHQPRPQSTASSSRVLPYLHRRISTSTSNCRTCQSIAMFIQLHCRNHPPNICPRVEGHLLLSAL